MSRSKTITITLPLEIIYKVDSERGDICKSRYYRRLIERGLSQIQKGEVQSNSYILNKHGGAVTPISATTTAQQTTTQPEQRRIKTNETNDNYK